MSPGSRSTIQESRPGRSCPLAYRYSPASLARDPEVIADALYVVGGLYGNRPALASVLSLAAAEPGRAALVFNGDFNWFNVDEDGFDSVNRSVLGHIALRGNVETELAADDPSAGCGCAYPDWVSDAEVGRSNAIVERLRDASRAHPALRAALAGLPMNLVARVGAARVAVVHGDAESLAGWGFSQEALDDERQLARIGRWFDEARVDIFASSHTCLPVFCELAGGHVVANNGAAGMPNFRAARHGVVTRIGTAPASGTQALYAVRAGNTYVEALPVHYDTERFEQEFLANWPAGSPAHASYYDRIRHGPSYEARRAIRRHAFEKHPRSAFPLAQDDPT